MSGWDKMWQRAAEATTKCPPNAGVAFHQDVRHSTTELREINAARKPPTVTDQTKRIGVAGKKRWVYKQAELQDARAKFAAYLTAHRPDEPFRGPLRLVVKWLFPVAGKHRHGQPKDTRPDTHNLQKLFVDVMTELGFWLDDAQIASEIIEKFWSSTPGIYVAIEALPCEQ